MNIVQLQDLLKGMPDQRLQQELQTPTGSVPQYLVLSEVVRRDKLRQDATTAQPSKTTVVEDVMNAAANPGAAPAQPDMQQEAAPAYASGGFISPSESMGHLGVRGYPQAQKPTPMLGQNVSSNSMFKPNMNPAPQMGGFMTQNPQQNAAVPAQHNDVYNNNYTEDYAYADGGSIKMAVGGLPAAIIGAESGGNPTARNPYSSAAGLGQFIDSTWLSFLEDTQPGLVNRIGTSAALALKMNPELSTKAVDWYSKKNTEALGRAGFQPTDANLYLAHFAGPGGAKAVLGSDPSKKVADILGEGVVKANPFLKNMTAGELTSWAAKKVGSKPAAPVAMAGRETTRGTGVGAGTTAVGYDPAKAPAGLAALGDAGEKKLDLSSLSDLGSALMSKKPEPVELLPPPKANPELAMAAAPKTPEEILAEYRALRQMANGGAVGMDAGGVPPSAAFLETLTPEQKASMTPQQLQQAWVDFYTDVGKRHMGATYAGGRSAGALSPGQRAVNEARTAEEIVAANKLLLSEKPGATPPKVGSVTGPRGPETTWAPTAEQGAAAKEREANIAARKLVEEEEKSKSPLDQMLEYLRSRDEQMKALYQSQIDEEKKRMEESGGLGAFLRRMGIGMLTDSSSFGKSVQAGLANATTGYEEGRQAAMDRLRELQMKQQLAGIEGAGDIAKLGYEASVEAAKLAREGKAGQKDYLAQLDDIAKAIGNREDKIAEAGGDPATDTELQQLYAIQRKLLSGAGMDGIMGAGATGIPAGVTVTRK